MVAVWPRGARVSLIGHLAPQSGPTISSALGLSFSHCPASETLQRLNAVAGAVAHFQRAMMTDIDQAAKASGMRRCWPRSRISSKASISPATAACGSTVGPGRYLVIPRWVVWGQPTRRRVATLSLCGGHRSHFTIARATRPDHANVIGGGFLVRYRSSKRERGDPVDAHVARKSCELPPQGPTPQPPPDYHGGGSGRGGRGKPPSCIRGSLLIF
jgi:hypothetical protein